MLTRQPDAPGRSDLGLSVIQRPVDSARLSSRKSRFVGPFDELGGSFLRFIARHSTARM